MSADGPENIPYISFRVDTDLRTDGGICADEKLFLMKRKAVIRPRLEKLLGRRLASHSEVFCAHWIPTQKHQLPRPNLPPDLSQI